MQSPIFFSGYNYSHIIGCCGYVTSYLNVLSRSTWTEWF